MPAQGTGRTKAASTDKKLNRRTNSTNSSPRTQRKRPGDLTGITKQKQEQAHAEELEAKQAEMALANAVKVERQRDEVIDYTSDKATEFRPQHEDYENADTPLPVPVEERSGIDVTKEVVEIRVNSLIEDMTFGREVIDPGSREAGNEHEPVLGNLRFYTFEEGYRYKVPVALALHLEELGYLYH